MLRFLHAADLHLDSALRGLGSRNRAPVDLLRGATRRAFENLIELALRESVDFVVLAGDVYDRDWKDYGTGLFFRKGMARLGRAGIPVYLVAGNHDAASVISKKMSLPDNVTTFSSEAPESVELASLPVALHGRSFPNRRVDENWVSDYPDPVAGKFNIGILHTSLAGSDQHDTYAPCSQADLVGKGYDYWALGHIHQPAILHRDPWIVYPGNLQGRHAREEGPRGCRLVTVDDGLEVTDCAWHDLDVARWAIVDVDLEGVESMEDALGRAREAAGEAVSRADGRMAALRVRLVGATPLHGLLRSRPDRFDAEMHGFAEELGDNAAWIEQVVAATRPVVSLKELASRDDLTRTVVDALRDDDADLTDLPDEVGDMMASLPGDLRDSVRQSWSGEGRQALLEDACAIILERLASRGEEG